MIFRENEQNLFLNKLKEELTDIDFGRICCNLVIADQHLMYVDFKREKNERFYIHSKPENNEGEKK
jgi:hypothetical protein